MIFTIKIKIEINTLPDKNFFIKALQKQCRLISHHKTYATNLNCNNLKLK